VTLSHQIDDLKEQRTRLEKDIIQLKNQVAQAEKTAQFLQRELEDKKSVILLREKEIKDHFASFNKNLALSANPVPGPTTADMAGTMALLERTGEDRRREVDRLQILL
jgi:chromosome segregation ATPase